MKAKNFIKKITLLSLTSGSFLVFGGLYQTMKVNDISYMKDSEVKFAKRFDENKERFVASSDKMARSIHYVPVNSFNQNLLNGKWEIVRIEDEKGETILDATNGDKSKLVDFDLVATSQIKINGDEKYLFDISFLHQEGKNIALFRSYGSGFEMIEARKVNEVKKEVSAVVLNKLEENEEVLEVDGLEETVSLSLERALVPNLSNTVLVGQDFVNGEVTIGNGAIQGLTFSVVSKEKKEITYSISDIQIQDGGVFQVEIDGIDSAGIVTNNGKDSYRIRFSTGPLQGSFLNFVTDAELEKIQDEIRKVEELKEEREANLDIAVIEVNEAQEEIANQRQEAQRPVIDAGFKAKVRAEIEEEVREEIEMEYEVEGIQGEENIVAEVTRQGFTF